MPTKHIIVNNGNDPLPLKILLDVIYHVKCYNIHNHYYKYVNKKYKAALPVPLANVLTIKQEMVRKVVGKFILCPGISGKNQDKCE